MKFISLSIFIAFSFDVALMGQNLVPNPGFEMYNNCPANLSGISFSPSFSNFPTVDQWVSPLGQTTPDYYNVCANGTPAGVPNGAFGPKQPHNGNAYAGIIAWQGAYSHNVLVPDYREYLQTELLQPMAAGQEYCVSFYVSTSDLGDVHNYNYVFLNQIGINFSH